MLVRGSTLGVAASCAVLVAATSAVGLQSSASSAVDDHPAVQPSIVVGAGSDGSGSNGGQSQGGDGNAGGVQADPNCQLHVVPQVADVPNLVVLGGPLGCPCPSGAIDATNMSDFPEELRCFVILGPGESLPPPTVDDLVPGAYDEAVRLIPLPVLDVSPPAEFGGVVNFGLWLAVEPVEPVVARAEVGSVWAQATATLTGTTWDMGNGDVVECEGIGDPIIDLDTDEQSPICGYTYGWPSAPQFTGTNDLAYHASVTTHWEVRMTGSDGRDVAMDPIDVAFEFSYQVREIQTIGTP